jgi:hypothetical protein
VTGSAGTRPSYFERLDRGRYRPTAHTGGAWRPDEQHFSPLGGLIVHEIDRFLAARRRSGMRLSRVSFDILGQIAIDDLDVSVDLVRPGRTIELVDATIVIAQRPVVRARAWLLAAEDTSAVAGGEPAPLDPPESLPPLELTSVWPGGYIASLDVRAVGTPRPGRTTAWVSTDVRLVANEPSSSLATYIALVDTANGIAVRRPPTEWMFPNVDLSIHLHRQPRGRWVGLDTTVVFGAEGQGVTTTVLHDTHGPIGYGQQMLTVRLLAQRSSAENRLDHPP